MRLGIEHRTRYLFGRPVTLEPHRLLVTPRSGHDLQLVDIQIASEPAARIEWADDVFANRVAELNFELPASNLLIVATTLVEQTAPTWPVFSIAVEAHQYPFRYSNDDCIDLGALLVPKQQTGSERVASWARGFVAGQPTDTLALLKDINNGILPAVTYRVRDEAGTQSAVETLALGSGSCRDIAELFIACVRHLGFAARAVSGYVYDPEAGVHDAGSTHAWAEVYLPGAGWIAFDPTHGRMGDAYLIPVAVGRYNSQIMPVTGGYLGFPADAVGMEVEVRVTPMIESAAHDA
jgi:transglutaminase-like putative cysteine protease